MVLTNETLKIIQQRRSIRKYKDTQIEDDQLHAILEAGLYAPNAGDQAWHFTVVQNKRLLSKLNSAAKQTALQINAPGLAALAEDEHFHCLYGAPTLVIVSGNQQVPIPLESDCAAATQNMLLAAESLGLGSCWVYFVLLAFQSSRADELRSLLKMPEGYKPYSSAVFGVKYEMIAEAPERKPNLITLIP